MGGKSAAPVAAGASAIGFKQPFERRVVGPSKAIGDAGAVMVVVDLAAFCLGGGPYRRDDWRYFRWGLATCLPAGAETAGPADRCGQNRDHDLLRRNPAMEIRHGCALR